MVMAQTFHVLMTGNVMITALYAQEILKKIFEFEGEIISLPGECDINFHVKTQASQEFLLKISPLHTEKNILEMQNDVLLWLSSLAPFFASPRVQATFTGKKISEFRMQDKTFFARLFTYLPGKTLVEIADHSPALLLNLGKTVGELSCALSAFQHPAAKRYLHWDLKQASWLNDYLSILTDEEERKCIEYFLKNFELHTFPILSQLRQSIIHGDINDHNILVSEGSGSNYYVSGFIDFGDLVETATICEIAIACAYVMLNKADPLAAAAYVVQGYHAVFPLQTKEIEILFDLICIRLCMSVVNAAIEKKKKPHDDYVTVSEKPAWELLKKLQPIPRNFAQDFFYDSFRR